MGYPVFLLSLLVPLAVVLLLKVNIVAEYLRNNEDDNISISIYTLHEHLKYKFEIPLIDVGNEGVKFRLQRERGKKDAVTGEKKKKTGIIEFIQRTVHIIEVYKSPDRLVCRLRCFIKKRVVFDKFMLDVSQGTGDAASTGFVNGLLWMASGILVSFLSGAFRIKSKDYMSKINITPSYDKNEFKVDLFCIFHTKLVHIIVILAAVLIKRIHHNKFIKKIVGGDLSG